jgi:hypothetical protein
VARPAQQPPNHVWQRLDKANKAKVDEVGVTNEAGLAKANEVTANAIDKIVAVNEAIVANVADKAKAIVIDKANSANEANEANFAKVNKLLANDGNTIVLQSLTKYCKVFMKDKGDCGMGISNK